MMPSSLCQAGGKLFPMDAEHSFSAFELSYCKLVINIHIIDTRAWKLKTRGSSLFNNPLLTFPRKPVW
jgi:hypothetical protein